MSEGELDLTTIHVRRALEGERESLEWIVARFSPLLFAQARYRLRHMGGICDPEDLVNDVWIRVLPQLSALSERDGRYTPVVVRYLSTTLLRQINNLIRRKASGADTGVQDDPTPYIPAETRGPISKVVSEESCGMVLSAIDELSDRDREVVVLRAIEQHSNQDAAELLGIAPNTAAQAYGRALDKLREKLPGSVFDEL